MKIRVHCYDCSKIDPATANNLIPIQLTDDFTGDIDCPRGHKSRVQVLGPRYEILFESAANALLDGYCREAVASFAAAAERFHEYVIKELLLRKGIKSEEIDRLWSLMSKQTERQSGAFAVLLLAELGVHPLKDGYFRSSRSEFRNDIVHKGKFPSEVEALNFGTMVQKYIVEVEQELMKTDRQSRQPMFKHEAGTMQVDGRRLMSVFWDPALTGERYEYSKTGEIETLESWLSRARAGDKVSHAAYSVIVATS